MALVSRNQVNCKHGTSVERLCATIRCACSEWNKEINDETDKIKLLEEPK